MGTSTSSFGVGKRESHDSTDFYARFAAPEISDDDALGAPGRLDVIHVGDARAMAQVPDASVALVVTSPPYFAGKEYETALGEGHVPGDYIDYLTMLCWSALCGIVEVGGSLDRFRSQPHPAPVLPAGKTTGSVILRKVRQGSQPRFPAASSKDLLTAFSAVCVNRNTKGKNFSVKTRMMPCAP